jgi:polysaccharide biosynthesis protein PslH
MNTLTNLQHYTALNTAEKPRLLLLTQVLPFPPDAGPKIKTFNLIKYLANRFDITLVSFVRPANTAAHLEALREYCREVHTVSLVRAKLRDVKALARSLITGQPFLMVRDQSGEMAALLARLVKENNFAVVHADQLNMGQFALPLGVPVSVLDQHNAVWLITDRIRSSQTNPLKKLILTLETFKLRRYEQKICKKFSGVLAVSPSDAKALGLECKIVPIGVDAENCQPLARKPGSLNLVSLGTMFYPPNVEGALWFGQKVFPLIQKHRPNATFSIIGANPPAKVYQLAQKNPAIKILGYVENLRPVLEDSAGLIVPLLAGGGMRVKILDALALGLPIITTTLGGEGVALVNEQTALIADTPEEFAEACLKLLDSAELSEVLAGNGRQLALQVYDFRQAYKPLDDFYTNLLATT